MILIIILEYQDPVPGFTVEPASDDLFVWTVGLYGAPGTIYEEKKPPVPSVLLTPAMRLGRRISADLFWFLVSFPLFLPGFVWSTEHLASCAHVCIGDHRDYPK